MFERVMVIDSHTAGEPTRVVVSGGPDLGGGDLSLRRERFRREHDDFRSAVVNEPRGSDVIVGALLCEPADPRCAAGVIFFDNVGTMGMCGHGVMGVAVTLAHLGRISPGTHLLETPVGIVSFEYQGGSGVTIENVPSYRYGKDVAVAVEGVGTVTGDIAWGGQLVFPCRQARAGNRPGERRASDRLHLEDSPGARTPQNHRRRRQRDRPHRAIRSAARSQHGLPQLRPPSGQDLRPLPLWHRHQRQARLPLRGRGAGRGPDMAAGGHTRHGLRR